MYIYIYIYIYIGYTYNRSFVHCSYDGPGSKQEKGEGSFETHLIVEMRSGRSCARVHPVSMTRFPLSRFSPGAGLLRNPYFTLPTLRFSSGWVRKDGNLVTETGCRNTWGCEQGCTRISDPPTKVCWLRLSMESPMDMRIPPLTIKTLFKSNPPKSRILVRRSAVHQAFLKSH